MNDGKEGMIDDMNGLNSSVYSDDIRHWILVCLSY